MQRGPGAAGADHPRGLDKEGYAWLINEEVPSRGSTEPETEYEPGEGLGPRHVPPLAPHRAGACRLRSGGGHSGKDGGEAGGEASEHVHGEASLSDAPCSWLARLHEEYGEKLLLLLWSSQHMLKGVVQQFQGSAVMWLLQEYHVQGSQMQIYISVSSAAWAMKPIIGVISDVVPICGYRKAPYVIATSLGGVACAALIGFSTAESMSVLATVLCLFGVALQGSTCDLLTEAKYSEQLHKKPAHGPDLLTYVWGGIGVGNMLAIVTVGVLLTSYGGPRSVFLACLAPCAAILYPTAMNYFEETRLSREATAEVRKAFMRQGEVLFLCVLMTALTLFLIAVGTASDSHDVHFVSAVGVLVVLLVSFHSLLRPEIAKINAFFVLQATLSLNISGATFYFYTDQTDQYPEGPHFSSWFFASILGFIASLMSLVGLVTYTSYMKHWQYRSLILLSNILLTVFSLLDTIIFLRLNVRLGIPDTLFVLGSSFSTVVVRQWQWMPGVVVMSQLCPLGMEATMFALLAGCVNIGGQLSDYLGAYLLQVLGIHPAGAVGEGQEFRNLWKASCISTLLPACTILLIPTLIPRAKQTDKLLLDDPSSATTGSPFSRWRKRS